VAASDPASSPLQYRVSAGSPPPGVVVASDGLLSGSINLDVTATYNFTVTASFSSLNINISRTFFINTICRLMTLSTGEIFYDRFGVPQTFSLASPGTVYTLIVHNPFHLNVSLWGAAGSTLYSSGAATFGYGGMVSGTVQSIVPGVYYVVVGQQPTAGTGGYPGGGLGQQSGSGGGGFSGLWQGTNDPLAQVNRPTYFLLAGAGAGHSQDYTAGTSNTLNIAASFPGFPRGGDGGFPTGSVGNANSPNMALPTGGTQTAGGSSGRIPSGSSQGATAGTAFVGGTSGLCGSGGSAGGAGGAGWFGGGGGNAHCGDGGGAGGGGSSYFNPFYVNSFGFANAVSTGNGLATFVVGHYLGSNVNGPVWVTAAVNLGNLNFNPNMALSYQFNAIDYDGDIVTYRLVSGQLPPGLTLSTVGSQGILSGSLTNDVTATYTFVIGAVSDGITVGQTFSLSTVRRLVSIMSNSVSTTYFDTGVRQTANLGYVGSPATVSVHNAFNLTVTCRGAAGSTLYTSTTTSATFGYGGSVTAVIRANPGTYFAVAGQQPTGGTGGYPGGGTGQQSGSAGGGFSGFWQGTSDPLAVANRPTYFLVAGAGGGHSNNLADPGSSNSIAPGVPFPGFLRAGDGGYLSGSVGNANGATMTIATGGTQTAGGAAARIPSGSTQGATAGSAFLGGSSGSCGAGGGSGGAGGAGWFGGGGGNAHCGDGGGAGGGGSSYFNATLVVAGSFTFANAVNTGHGSLVLLIN
jgi:hypothetical protein